ncbi:DUF1697 domain-containing protein [Nocardioides sp. Kera G14]|uniref:DUF1697 domain-containing protein n=1 Tax=Nocardioides sp. Kera G14 TaxID=2884264 RepID=UPI001D10A013|nr:DUF1697 domain-containing protein [Nocardioides sp. Kera G14]UDY22148.1 DUF1697 domain-containing protein [Nocardioides sp. Kera G14]
MTAFVALIRGIGPGDPRKSNESLRGVLEELGFTGVKSVISSGNVIFESDSDNDSDVDALGNRIEAAWPELRGFTALTVVRSAEQIAHLLEQRPFGDVEHGKASYQFVTFFKQPLAAPPEPPADFPVAVNRIVDGALCNQVDTTSTGGPEVMKWLDKTFKKQTTSRTPLTLARILKKMEG